MENNYSTLKRSIQHMPDFVKKALEKENLTNNYYERPAYQKNDYLGWINGAKKQETKEKRLTQMLNELRQGGIYMNMEHPASKKEK